MCVHHMNLSYVTCTRLTPLPREFLPNMAVSFHVVGTIVMAKNKITINESKFEQFGWSWEAVRY